jgi:hypothetical protein
MVDSAAACARGRARSSRSRTQGEAFGGAKGEAEDADPAQISRVIRVRGVVESTIYAHRLRSAPCRSRNRILRATPPLARLWTGSRTA